MDILQKDLNTSPGISIAETPWQVIKSHEPSNLWALVDGANWPEIQSILAEQVPPHACLYSTTDPDSQRIAPWLIRVEPDSAIQSLLEARDSNTHAVVFFHSPKGIRQLRDHFRRYTMLWTPANPDMPVYFRFYDPRVLLDMITALDEAKTAQFFNGIEAFYIPISYHSCLPKSVNILPVSLGETVLITERCLRLAQDHPVDAISQTSQSFKVSQAEYQRFADLLRQRKPLNLAAKLYHTYQALFPVKCYEASVQIAYRNAAYYQFQSENELMLLADCYLWLGQDFPAQSPAAEVLLTEMHPQRLHHLMVWLQAEKQITFENASMTQ